jgi:hypothetical protein
VSLSGYGIKIPIRRNLSLCAPEDLEKITALYLPRNIHWEWHGKKLMDLVEFVGASLTEVLDGIRAAQKKRGRQCDCTGGSSPCTRSPANT